MATQDRLRQELAWLDAQAQDAERRRVLEEAVEALRPPPPCPACHHRSHDYLTVGDCVFWCKERECLCSVAACPVCYLVTKDRITGPLVDPRYGLHAGLCPGCWYEYPVILLG